MDIKDQVLRLQVLEGAAKKRLGTWSRRPHRGWEQATQWMIEHAPDLDPSWLDANKGYGLWGGVSRTIQKIFSRTGLGQYAWQTRHGPEDLVQSVIMGLPLGSGQERDPIYYALGVRYRDDILSGRKDPEDIRKIAARRAAQVVLNELRVSGKRIRRRDDTTDISLPSSDDDFRRKLPGERGISIVDEPAAGALYEFLGGNPRAIRRTVMRTIADGLQGRGDSPLWRRLVEVWEGRVPELSRAKASPSQLEALRAVQRAYEENRGKIKFKDVAQDLGVSPSSLTRQLQALGKKIDRYLSDPQGVEALFGTPELRKELRQTIRVASTRRVVRAYYAKKRGGT